MTGVTKYLLKYLNTANLTRPNPKERTVNLVVSPEIRRVKVTGKTKKTIKNIARVT